MSRFIKANMVLRNGLKKPILINVNEIAFVKGNGDCSACSIIMAHPDDFGNHAIEVDLSYKELVDILYSNDNILMGAPRVL
jgi:hypothetical protein